MSKDLHRHRHRSNLRARPSSHSAQRPHLRRRTLVLTTHTEPQDLTAPISREESSVANDTLANSSGVRLKGCVTGGSAVVPIRWWHTQNPSLRVGAICSQVADRLRSTLGSLLGSYSCDRSRKTSETGSFRQIDGVAQRYPRSDLRDRSASRPGQ